jgi:hypothetical protein
MDEKPTTQIMGETIGRDPATMTPEEWAQTGHEKRPLLSVLRAKCLDCRLSREEVRKCSAFGCALWPYRMGSNPFITPMSEERREAASVRLKEYRAANPDKMSRKPAGESK